MQKLIKNVFEEECHDLVIGPDLAKRVIQYQLGFVNKNEENIKFFGGNLTGVQVVRFTNTDRAWWFEDILGADEDVLREKLIALPAVFADRLVSSDTMNISCAWLVHCFLNAGNIPDKLKHAACISVLLVLQYKFLTSRLYRHFHYPADRATAEAAYAALSMKFALKKYGSWGATLNARAEAIIDPHEGLHYKTLKMMNNDVAVGYFLNDTQTRIRDMLKNIVNIHYAVSKQGGKISSVSAVIEHDGAEILRDRTKSLSAYTRYLNSIVTDKNSFIREELLVIIEKIIHTMPPAMFRKTLDWISDNYRNSKHGEIEEVLKETLVHSFDYIMHHQSAARNGTDIAGLLVRLKGVYTAARSTDPILFSLRENMEAIVKQATATKSSSTLSPIRTGVLLYIVLRAITMKHYTSSV